MATRLHLGIDVFNEAINRMVKVYETGARVIVSFSAGKDSTSVLEVCRFAAMQTGAQLEVAMRDEEINLPGTYEYAERVANDPSVQFHWVVANQPIINVFNREQPYFWVFDPQLPPDKWVRKPPPTAMYIKEQSIDQFITAERFPPPPGKELISVIGLRVQESKGRLFGLYSSGGFLTKTPNKYGVRMARPIYDWSDGHVWKAIGDNKWDYNKAYDTMRMMGRPRGKLRIAPPTMSPYGIDELDLAARAWPEWFDRVARRLPGVRTAAQFGKRSIEPVRYLGEDWEACFRRTVIGRSPRWIVDRATKVMETMLHNHGRHSAGPFPQVEPCPECRQHYPKLSSWKDMTNSMYTGDPFSLRASFMPYVEPEFFRVGAGYWGGKPSF